MMGRAAIGGMLLMTSACAAATPPQPAEEEASLHPDGDKGCNAAKAKHLLGRKGTPKLGAEAVRLTRALTLRWIRPGEGVTMDFNFDRLNIEVDEKGRVIQIRCG